MPRTRRCTRRLATAQASLIPSKVATPRDVGRLDYPLSPDDDRRRALKEALLAFLGTTVLCAALWQSRGVLGDWASSFIPLVFLAVPWWLLDRRRAEWAAYALTPHPIDRGLRLVLIASLAIFPPFYGAFLIYYRTICDLGFMPEFCLDFLGAGGGALAWPPGLLEQAVIQLVAVALPEEFFFRGYLQGRLAESWPDRRRLWGAPVGPALVVTAALFAIGHVLVDGNPLRLAVFFPGLVFGWMRARTGSILAGVLFHALCNLYSDVLHRSFFG